VSSVLALVAALVGPVLAAERPGATLGQRRRALARHVGTTLFLALAVLTWILAKAAIQPSRLDPGRAAIGTIAWGVFALSWADPWRYKRPPPSESGAPALQARAALPPFAVPVAAAAILGAIACLLLAWRIRDPGRAVLGQGAAIACAVALVTVGATIAAARGKRTVASPRRLGRAALRPLIILGLVAVGGGIVLALR
jgi:hypothetical protein